LVVIALGLASVSFNLQAGSPKDLWQSEMLAAQAADAVDDFKTEVLVLAKALVAGTILKRSDFKRISTRLGTTGVRARKVSFVAARTARQLEHVTTYWNGKETTNIARPGDVIVTSLTRRRTVLRDKRGNPNQYVIKARTFRKVYETAPGRNRLGKFFNQKASSPPSISRADLTSSRPGDSASAPQRATCC
jgi:hypothetical protein